MFKSIARAISPFAMKKEKSSSTIGDQGEKKDFQDYYWDLNGVNLSIALFFFYSQFNPTKVDRVDQIVQEFKGEEVLMLQEICERYNLTEADMQKYLNRGRKSEQSRKSISQQRNNEAIADLGYVAKDDDFRFDEFDNQSTDDHGNKSVDNSTISSKASSQPKPSSQPKTPIQRPAPPPVPPQRTNQPPPPSRPLMSAPAPPPPISRPRPSDNSSQDEPYIQTLPRSSVMTGSQQHATETEITRTNNPPVPGGYSMKSKPAVVESVEQRVSVVQPPPPPPARKISPSAMKSLASQRMIDLAKRAKSPATANHTEIMTVGGSKVAVPPKPPAPSKPKPPAKHDPSDDMPENNDTALFFNPQPSTSKAAVVAMPNPSRHNHAVNVDDDDDDSRTNNSDLTRDDVSIAANPTPAGPIQSSSDMIISQLRSELEQARQDAKDMFNKLAALMTQQQAAQHPPPQHHHDHDIADHASDVSFISKHDHNESSSDANQGSKTIARVHQELKAVQHELRRVNTQLNDSYADRADLLNLLKSVAAAQVHGKGVLESYVSQYGHGVHDSEEDLITRIEAVLHHRRVNDFDDHVDNPVDDTLFSASVHRSNSNQPSSRQSVHDNFPKPPHAAAGETSVFGSSKAIPGMARSHTVILKEILESNSNLDPYRQYTQSSLNRLLEPSIPNSGLTNNKSRILSSNPLPGTTGGINNLRVSSGGMISSASPTAAASRSRSTPSSPVYALSSNNSVTSGTTNSSAQSRSRFMNINSDVLWDPAASKTTMVAAANIARSISSNSNRSNDSRSASGSSYNDRRRRGHTASVVATNLLQRWEGKDDVGLSPTSFAKSQQQQQQRSFHNQYNEANLADQYEKSKDYYRNNITQAKVSAQLAQNRLNYQTGLTGQAMIESVLSSNKADMMMSTNNKLSDGLPNDFVEGWDDIRNRVYYYSKSRKKSVWKLPDGATSNQSRSSSRASSPMISSAKGSNTPSYRTASPRKMTEFSSPIVRAASPTTNYSYGKSGDGDTSWVEAYDNKLQRRYWYHKVTRQTSWVDPHEN